MSLFAAPVTFLLAQKSNQKRVIPNSFGTQCFRPQSSPPPLGKEANALFYRLVLRTTPYSLVINILRWHNLIVHFNSLKKQPEPGKDILENSIFKKSKV